jgi:hypothetical protein
VYVQNKKSCADIGIRSVARDTASFQWPPRKAAHATCVRTQATVYCLQDHANIYNLPLHTFFSSASDTRQAQWLALQPSLNALLVQFNGLITMYFLKDVLHCAVLYTCVRKGSPNKRYNRFDPPVESIHTYTRHANENNRFTGVKCSMLNP